MPNYPPITINISVGEQNKCGSMQNELGLKFSSKKKKKKKKKPKRKKFHNAWAWYDILKQD